MNQAGLEREYQEWATNLPSIHDGLQPLLHTLVMRMLRVTEASVGSILLEEDGHLVPAATLGIDAGDLEGARFPIEGGPLAPLLQGSGATYLADLLEVANVSDLARRAGLRSTLLTPLRARNQIVGVAAVSARDVRDFTPIQVARFEALSDRAAVAIDNTHLYEEAQQRANQLKVLAELSATVGAEIDARTIAARTAESACKLVGADYCLVAMLATDGTDGEVREPTLHFSAPVPPEKAEAIESLVPILARRSASPRITDLQRNEVEPGLAPTNLPWRSLIAAPIRWAGSTRAVLLLAREDPPAFRDADEEFVRLLVGQASIAFHNSFLLGELQLRGEVAQQRAHLLETLIGSIADPVFIAAPPGVIIDVNDRALRLLGISRDEITRPISDYARTLNPRRLDGSPLPVEEYPVIRALSGETFEDLSMIMGVSDAQQESRDAIYTFSGAPVLNSLGEIILAVVVGHDVTGERNLIRAQEDLMSVASHELKTPLTLVKANAQLLARAIHKLDDPKLSQRCDSLAAQVDRMQRLVDLLLDLSRLETGRLTVQPEPLDLADLLRQTVESYNLAQPNREVALRLSEEPVYVAGDALRLEQVLTNLLDNAARYSPEGETISVEIVCEGDLVRVSVADQGIGVPAEDLDRVFDRFYQVQGAPGALAGSMGMGLYISRGIIAAHGGKIWAESELGHGSTFHFALPLDREGAR